MEEYQSFNHQPLQDFINKEEKVLSLLCLA
jgi:hypothetical protein